MPSVDRSHASVSPPGIKDDTATLKRASPEPLHTAPVSKAQLDPPKSRDKSPTAEPKPSSKPDAARSATPPAKGESDSEKDEGEIVDFDIFSQILELEDDEDSYEFTQSMVFGFFEQATTKLKEMNDALSGKKLQELSDLGHFLKGSSAALGLHRVQSTCEKVQYCGQLREVVGIGNEKKLGEKEAIEKLAVLLKRVDVQCKEAEKWMKNFFDERTAQ